MATHFEHIPLLLTPSEVAKVTGVSERSQRNWRARGYLKPLEGGKHFRADVFDLAVFTVANLISDKLPVESAVANAELCAKRVAFYALSQEDAWENAESAIPFAGFFEQQATKAVSDRFQKFGRVIPARFFILWADGTEYWDYDLTHAFENANPIQLRGAVVVLDLNALGRELLNRKQPLMRLVRVDT